MPPSSTHSHAPAGVGSRGVGSPSWGQRGQALADLPGPACTLSVLAAVAASCLLWTLAEWTREGVLVLMGEARAA